MRNPDEFDAFYKDARDRLLLQTYALTGDLPASRAAVRDSFVVAWHHWRKISRLDDPESWARPHAWAHAQRRHTARLWHRDKSLDPDARATLDALGKLPVAQRKALLLTQLTTASMTDMAREVGLPRAEAERELQSATSQFAVHRDVPTTTIRPLFEPLREHAETARWPRPSIIRRAGAARRRTHTTLGAVAVVAGLVLTGSLVTDAAGVRPTLSREHLTSSAPHQDKTPAAEPVDLPEDVMLTSDQVGALVAGKRWSVTDTHDISAGDTTAVPCRQDSNADPLGTAALVRTFDTAPRKGAPRVSAVETTEVSATAKAARRTYGTTLDWYAGCTDRRVQLLGTHRVDRVGDQAMLFVLRGWDQPVSTLVVGVARTGQLTTTTTSRVTDARPPDLSGAAKLLGAAVDGVCGLPDAGACSARARLRPAAPRPVGTVPAMLAEVDLPPVTGVDRPWVGTEPRKAVENVAATRCDQADFDTAPMSNNLTRSFLIPRTRLAVQFGLTETVGSLPVGAARSFVDRIRARVAACPDKDPGTEVVKVAQVATGKRDLSIWRVTTEITDQMSVQYLMGIVRDGTSIAQVGFVPDRRVVIRPGAFVALVHRALDRLGAMPAPKG
jgi:DNA-directed RNA polymerase specialized sigma24 family protein